MNRTAISTALLVCSALVAAACSGGGDDEAGSATSSTTTVDTTTTTTTQPQPTTTTTIASTVSPVVVPTTVPDVLRMPLTGQPIADQSEVPDRPALVVKISNVPPSVLPQSGLNQADLVFEEVINGSVTRLAAVFHSEDADPVGPIRSGRFQDINLALSLNRPLFAWSGGNRAVTRAIESSDLIDLNAQGRTTGYYRRRSRPEPNDLYSSTDVLWGQAPDDAGRPSAVFSYLGDGDELVGAPAADIEITLDSVRARWIYDEETDGYHRRQNGGEHNTETSTGVEPVWTRNVVVMMADYGRNTFDGNPDAQVMGSNPVYVFTGGTVRDGLWLRFAPEDPFSLFDNVDDLNPLDLNPGRTWIEIPRNREGVLVWSE